MRLSLSSAGLQDWNGDVLVAGVLEGDAAGTVGRLEQRFPGLNAALEVQEFKAKASEQVVLTPLSSSPAKVVVLGLGKAELDTPVLWVDLNLLEGNIERLAAHFRRAGVGWRPHTKGMKIPAIAHKAAKDKFIQAMRRSASIIGRKQVHVDTFYLGKWPVKNSEYQVFVDAERAAGREIRAPMHWWRWKRVGSV